MQTAVTQVTAAQAQAVILAVTSMRDAACQAAWRLAQAGMGELPLWRRLDALEAEMRDLLVVLQPTLVLEQ